MKRIIYIIAANRWDSPWQHALDLAREMSGREWSVTAYTRDARLVDSRFRAAGIDLRHSPLRGFFDVPSAMRMARDLKYEPQGAIIHCQRYRDAYTVLLARKIAGRKDLKIVTTRHRVARALDSWLMRRIYRNINAHIFVSNACAQAFLSTWGKTALPFPAHRVHILRSAVNMDYIQPLPEPDKGPRTAVYCSEIKPGRGLETLIAALALLRGRRIRLALCGGGSADYIDTLRRQAQMAGVMDLIDWQLRLVEDPAPILGAAHFAVLPYTDAVALGISNIEAMAAGRAQIFTNVGAPPEYLRDNVDGLMVPTFDAARLAEAMTRLAGEDDQRRRMADNARRRYQQHLSWPNFADHLERLYKSL